LDKFPIRANTVPERIRRVRGGSINFSSEVRDMKYGVFQFSTDYAIRIDDLAREAEARGFESLFVPEHTHIPARRKRP